MESVINGHLVPKIRLEHRNMLAHLETCEKRISIQITFQFLVPFLEESMQGRQRTHLSSGLGRALVKYRTNGAGRYTYTIEDSTCSLVDNSSTFFRRREFY